MKQVREIYNGLKRYFETVPGFLKIYSQCMDPQEEWFEEEICTSCEHCGISCPGPATKDSKSIRYFIYFENSPPITIEINRG